MCTVEIRNQFDVLGKPKVIPNVMNIISYNDIIRITTYTNLTYDIDNNDFTEIVIRVSNH